MDYRALAEDLLNSVAFQKTPAEKPNELNSGERGILNYLHMYKNGALAGDISRDLGITTGRTAIALNGLEKKGLVRRRSAQKDRRCVTVHLTEAGAESAERFRLLVRDSIADMLARLGERDACEYVRIVKRIAEISPPGGQF